MFNFRKKRLCYDTTFYSEIVAKPYLEKGGGEMARSKDALQGAFVSESGGMDANADAEAFATELFGTLVDGQGAIKVQNPEGWANQCFEMLEGQTEWKQLQASCQRRKDLSAITTAGLLSELAPLLAQVREQEKGDGGNGDGDGDGDGGEQQQQGEPSDEDGLEGKVRQAVKRAKENAEKAEGAYGALAGTGMSEKQKGDRQAKERIIKKVMNDNKFKYLMDLIGKMNAIMKAKLARCEEKQVLMADVEYGNDLTRLTTLELANLATPATETLFLKRYSERKLMQRKASGTSNKGRGDMVILLDESGSMEGAPSHVAKTFAVAMVQLAVKQKRKAYVIGFDRSICYEYIFDGLNCWRVSRGIEYKCPAADGFEAILCFRPSGGTRFGVVMRHALNNLHRVKDGDLVMVTDACDTMPSTVVADVKHAQKHKGLRTSAVFISDYFTQFQYYIDPHRLWAEQIWTTGTDPETLIDTLTEMAVTAIK